ncbi:unnamed protein product [Calypogeia fissa]
MKMRRRHSLEWAWSRAVAERLQSPLPSSSSPCSPWCGLELSASSTKEAGTKLRKPQPPSSRSIEKLTLALSIIVVRPDWTSSSILKAFRRSLRLKPVNSRRRMVSALEHGKREEEDEARFRR